jgi:hypothetical protein
MSDDHLLHKTPEVLALSSTLPPQTLLIGSLIAALVLVVSEYCLFRVIVATNGIRSPCFRQQEKV